MGIDAPHRRSFQFQTGSIKSILDEDEDFDILDGFNSKLVRLKVGKALIQAVWCQRFNSKLVRLKAED